MVQLCWREIIAGGGRVRLKGTSGGCLSAEEHSGECGNANAPALV